MISLRFFSTFTILVSVHVLIASFSWSNHPNDGNIALAELINQSLDQNLEIQWAIKQKEEKQSKLRSVAKSFFPNLNLESKVHKTSENEISNLLSTHRSYLSLNANLFRGLRDTYENQLQGIDVEIAEIQLKKIRAEQIEKIKKAYYELIFFAEAIDLKKRALLDNDAQSKIALKKKSLGFESESDFLEFSLREATILSDLSGLESDEAKKRTELLELARGKINSQQEETGSFQNLIKVKGHLSQVIPKFDPKHFPIGAEKIALEKIALEKIEREAFAIQEINLEIKKLEIYSQQLNSEYYPTIDLEAEAGKLNSQNNIGNYQVGFKFSLPLFSGLTTHDRKQTNLSEQKTVLAKKATILANLKVEILGIFADVQQYQKRIQLEEKNLERSEKFYQLVLSEYRRGVKSSSDAVSASERLLETKLRSLEYYLKLAMSFAHLDSIGYI